jgi:hypothetical protein
VIGAAGASISRRAISGSNRVSPLSSSKLPLSSERAIQQLARLSATL